MTVALYLKLLKVVASLQENALKVNLQLQSLYVYLCSLFDITCYLYVELGTTGSTRCC